MFKVGTRVKILATNTDFLKQYIGTTGEVMSSDDSGSWVKCFGGTKEGVWGFYNYNLEEVTMEFKVGQKVTVVNAGKTYSTYESWLDRNCPQFKSMWTRGQQPSGGQEYIIECAAEHIERPSEDTVLLISNGTKVYIIGSKGVKLVESQAKFKVGKKVKILSGCYGDLKKYEGTTQEIASVKGDRYYMKGLPRTMWDGIGCYWRETEIELVEEPKIELMTYKEALKAAIDGHKIQAVDYWNKSAHVIFDTDRFMYINKNGQKEEMKSAIRSYAGSKWKIYKEEPKALPKFSIGQSVVYRSNRHAKVVGGFRQCALCLYLERRPRASSVYFR